MPANLTPQYLEAEAKFKRAKTTGEKINALEVMMAVIPKHKGTERLRGQLKGRFGKSFPLLPISAKEGMNLEEMKKEVYQLLSIIRVYTKTPGKEPDFTEPVILKKGSTVEDVALSVHKDFAAKLRYARIWGSGKFDGQMARREYQISEGDVIELHI